ncbi:hypothetical protein [Limnoglobus roseus]|uniref:Uncharacterized protein n=1 Tax=Limnoglobus roseus TaxID=2598579 RepID=A0A5C1AH32_9BACT|nr:hypothetical protein [Limnoglobus roseus]QEL17467.1 hypothetical protein PX52LOC_04456 [Limnoglobus roseus]
MPLSVREQDAAAVLAKHHAEKAQRVKDRIDRLERIAVAKLRGRLAIAGKKPPTRAEENAAAEAAVRQDEQDRAAARSREAHDHNDVPAHRRIR